MKFSPLEIQFSIFGLVRAIFILLVATSSFAAEDELFELRINSNLIEPLEILGERSDWQVVISNHYDLLPIATGTRAANLAQVLAKQVENYGVAYAAADSAELAEIMDEISIYWVTLQQLHKEFFTKEAVSLLGHAYSQLFPLVIEN